MKKSVKVVVAAGATLAAGIAVVAFSDSNANDEVQRNTQYPIVEKATQDVKRAREKCPDTTNPFKLLGPGCK